MTDHTTSDLTYDLILVPTDGSEVADRAVAHGLRQASAHGARLVFLAVVEMSGTPAPEARDDSATAEQRKARQADVEALAEEAEKADITAEGVVKRGTPSRVILDQAATRGADLIVMGTHARSGVARFLYGSVTEQIIDNGDTPVLAVQG